MIVVIIGPVHPYRGGIAHHTALLARALVADGHQVNVLTYRSLYPRWLFPGRGMLDPSAQPLKVPSVPVLRPLWPPSWLHAARMVRAAQPDLVLAQWWVPYFAPSMRAVASLVARSNIRLAFICHNVLPHDGGGMIDRVLVRWALGKADAWIVHSGADEDALTQLLGLTRGSGTRRVVRCALPRFDLDAPAEADAPTPDVLGNTVDSEAAMRVREADALRSNQAIPPGADVALFFGFVRPYKGVMTLIEALPAAIRSLPSLHVMIAGEFWEDSQVYRDRAAELGILERVHIDDRYIPNEEVGAYFTAAEVCVLPYREATQSAIVPLAMAAGVPVIATRVGGLPDVIDHGVNGLLVEPEDPDELAAAIVRFFQEPGLAETLAAGVLSSRARFDWSHMVSALRSLAR